MTESVKKNQGVEKSILTFSEKESKLHVVTIKQKNVKATMAANYTQSAKGNNFSKKS